MKTTRGISILAAAVALALVASPSSAQVAKPATAKRETMKQLKAEAKITEKAARVTALAQVPGGHVRKHELERENGKLVYSYDIATKGKAGIDEVQIDAITGAVVSNTHETPAMEKAEKKADRAEKKEMKAEKKEEKKAAQATKKP
jgi:uncharacterized membrane protein YkoI